MHDDDFYTRDCNWMRELSSRCETAEALAAHWENECKNLAQWLQEARAEISSLKTVLGINDD